MGQNHNRTISGNNYFSIDVRQPTGHDKGLMDGVGVLKKLADDHVLRRKNINIAAHFVNLLKNSNILLHEGTDNEIIVIEKLIPKNIDAIPRYIRKIVLQKASEVSMLLYQY
ncbi:hypothetical protein HHI36_004784 [Cryptolaemus montrouzieri]|uniref:Uncharacterized protein n=1 Tax=Cryptolaemus montrouzieri TaxID=559131 RepID=A0ABD2NT54_9CUCU